MLIQNCTLSHKEYKAINKGPTNQLSGTNLLVLIVMITTVMNFLEFLSVSSGYHFTRVSKLISYFP